MTTLESATATLRRLRLPNQKYISMPATLLVLIIMYSYGSSQYRAFSDAQVVLNVFIDNAFLMVVAVGMTFVILQGGIDLSVGAVVALSTRSSRSMVRTAD